MKVELGPYTDNEEERHVVIHIDDYDTWNADDTLALIAVPLLKRLRKFKHGSPLVDIEDVPEELQLHGWPQGQTVQYDMFSDDEHAERCDEYLHARWDWVLDEIIWSLENIGNDCPDEFFTEKDSWDHELGISKYDIDLDGLRAHRERVQNGCVLFGKYFQGLWD